MGQGTPPRPTVNHALRCGPGRTGLTTRLPPATAGADLAVNLPAPVAQSNVRRVTPEPLNVAPHLVGLVLADPVRRAAAMGVDLLVVALLSGASGIWLAAGLLLVALQLRSEGRGGAPSRLRAAAGWLLVALFVGLAAREAWTDWRRPASAAPPGASRATAAAEAEGEAQASAAEVAAVVAGALREAGVAAPLSVPASSAPVSAASAAPTLASAAEQTRALRKRVARLEEQLAEARKPQPFKPLEAAERFADGLGASFGWGIVYFSLLPAFWNGQTLGKRLLRLQVIELTGKPMTVMRCLRRYGGYAAGMATGGLGFAQVLWDVNRQGLQDRAAHTVVVALAPGQRAAVNAAPPASAPPAAGPAAG